MVVALRRDSELEEIVRSVKVVSSLGPLKGYANSMAWLGQPGYVVIDSSGLMHTSGKRAQEEVLRTLGKTRKSFKLLTTPEIAAEIDNYRFIESTVP